jgi:hypothetical protein
VKGGFDHGIGNLLLLFFALFARKGLELLLGLLLSLAGSHGEGLGVIVIKLGG